MIATKLPKSMLFVVAEITEFLKKTILKTKIYHESALNLNKLPRIEPFSNCERHFYQVLTV